MSEFYVLFDALDFVLIRKKHEILSNSCSYFFCPFFFKGPIIFLGNLNVFMERSILFFTVPLFVILLIPRQGSSLTSSPGSLTGASEGLKERPWLRGKCYFYHLSTGSAGKGSYPGGKANCTMTLGSDDFVKMFKGQMNPTQAFMGGKLKIKGDMMMAMKFEKMMGAMKSKL